ncbi:DNA-directed RNA polymerase subunit beta [Candidatus Cerribacteria bacterium 'Amazon FNV 2010 28 9']|uniref:DNA-directed RNA polymerase subunit beta n=1 Tax=Candidatus Cerribacteria bacterium 'Amazon FNV 2010 28 9' TaxID=2081795 RepID=A0A317JNF6_9BACT|nr:MAG: DNA-directed RNA polymerase subunit beta [Candidatus Cerribacteria bacterium 'Amazon FNV 2010 28 9']
MKAQKRLYWGKQNIPLPEMDLTKVQRESYQWFLEEGLKEALLEICGQNGIEDFTRRNWKLEFGKYTLGKPKISIATARQKALTYDMPLRVEATLTNKQTGEVTKQEVFLGDIPKMTPNGTFIINGVERAVVNQLVRAPGIFFSGDVDATTGRMLYYGELRPLRGSWLEMAVGRNDVITIKIDKHRKIPATVLLRAIGYGSNDEILELFKDIDTNPEHHFIQSTLDKDTTATAAEALIEIYTKMRPGEPAVLENAQELLNELFFDGRRYDLGRVGRYKLNRRLKVDVENTKQTQVLTKQDIIAAFAYLISLQNGQGKVDDIDHLSNRRVRRVGELVLTNAFRIGLLRLERAIREKMSLTKTDELLTPSSLVNARPLIATMSEFFRRNRLSTILDQTNPLSEIDNLRRLSVMGSGGVTRERASFSMRDINASQYSRIDAIRSPEGPNIGLVTYMSLYARVNDYGFLEAPYLRVVKEEAKNGDVKMKVTDEIVYLSADEEEEYAITHASVNIDADGYITDNWVALRYANDFTEGSVERVQFIDVVPRQVVGTSASLIPFVSHDEAIRALMGTHMQCQAVPLLKPGAPIVGTGMEEAVATAMQRAVRARHAGTVEYVDANKVIVMLDEKEIDKAKVDAQEHEHVRVDGKKEIYEIAKFTRTANSTCYSQKPAVTVGQKLKRGDLVIDGPSADGGELALGQNLTIAYTSYDGLGYEDAIIISDRLVRQDLLTSIHINEYECQVMDTKLGPEEMTDDIPNVSDLERRNLTIDGVVAIGAEVSPNDILVGKIAPKGETELTAEERLLRAIFGEKAREVRDTSLRMPHGESGTVIDVKVLDRDKGDELDPGVNKVVTVKVAQIRKVTVGDKLAGRHGNKGVISKIVPVEDMPYMPDGTPVDIIISPLSVLARMNLGQLLEAHLGWAAQKLGYKVAIPVFEEVDEQKIWDELDKAGLPVSGKVRLYDGRTGEAYGEDTVVGVGYMLKLIHMVDDKMHARSTGPYSLVTQQPLGGKAQMGGQRLGEMEVWALEAHKAAYTLQEMLTIKSDDVFGRTKAFEAIVTDQAIPASNVPESFKVLMRELNSLGLEIVPKEAVVEDVKDSLVEGVKENITDASGQTVVAGEDATIVDAADMNSEDEGGEETGEENDMEEAQEVSDEREPSAEELAQEE